MKLHFYLFLVILIFATSCTSQEKNNETTITYNAQTRGFIYSLTLENNTLEINNNGNLKKLILNKKNQTLIQNLLTKIKFNKINDNISMDDLAVDKAIKVVFKANFNKNSYSFEFNHNSLPKEIEELISQLQKLEN